MAITTTRDGRRLSAPFSWSYSKLDAFETCPKQYYHKQVAKDVPDVQGEAALYGDALHKAAAWRLKQKDYLGHEAYREILEPWCSRIESIGGLIDVEQKLAITKDFTPEEWFGKQVWMRGVADVVAVAPSGKVALAIDWKTGKVKEDSVQLALMAALVFAHYPSVLKIRTEFIWLKYDASTREDFAREDMPAVWARVLPRVQALQAAHEATNFPAKPGGLCRSWCPVKACEHCGR